MNKSKTIGLLVSGMTRSAVKDNFTFEVMTGVNDYIAKTDYDVILFNTNSTKQREKRIRNYVANGALTASFCKELKRMIRT